jgi:PAS domain S-box-containing protein
MKDISREHALNSVNSPGNQYQILFEHAHDAIVISTREGRFIEINQAYLNLLGYSKEELIRMNAAELWVRPGDRGRYADMMERQGFVRDYECQVRNKAGRIFDVLLTSSMQSDPNHGVVYYTIVRDVTEQKEAQKALKTSEELLQIFVENTPASVAMCDREMRYLAYSRRWIKDYGLPDEDLIGRCHYDVFGVIPERWKEEHQRCFQGEIINNEEEPFLRADGTVDWVRRTIHPWYDRDDTIGGLIMFTEVITDRKTVEQEREELIAKLQQALSDVKTLSGMLPICASCKRIRDDRGYWNQIETYIKKHSTAEFSHSLCPECVETLYGNQPWYQNNHKG